VNQTDLDYFRARASAERVAADRARHPAAAESHRRLAQAYAAMVAQAAPEAAPSAGAGRSAFA
jgi:hypothetical protein